MRNGVDGFNDVAQPGPHSLYFINHWAERISYIDAARVQWSATHFQFGYPEFAAAEHRVEPLLANTNYKESADRSATVKTDCESEEAGPAHYEMTSLASTWLSPVESYSF